MYRFVSNLKKDEYEKFIKKYCNTPITQEYNWALVKNNWDNILCGIYKDDILVAATLLLIKKTYFGIKLMYAPHGYLIDYNDFETLDFFSKELKKYAKSIRAFLIKIDPLIVVGEHYKEDFDGLKFSDCEYMSKLENLKKLGYIHNGYKEDMGAYIQPRFNMLVPLKDIEGNFFTEEQLFRNIKKKNKNQLGEYHTKRGIEFIATDNIDEFYELISYTEKKQHINLRDMEYFKRILNSYKERAKMFVGRIDLDKYLDFIEKDYSGKKEELLLEKKELIIELKEKHGNIINLCTALVILPTNESGIRVMEYLYAGSNVDLFPTLAAPSGLIYEILKFGIENKCHFCNLGGVDGTLKDNLSTFKLKFNPLIVEYVGEFDLVINRVLYFMFNKILPKIKKIMKR